jgi:hypothetical protein
MKENNFYSDDFEQLIRGKTEQYKMYPSENVWKGVHSALHTRRKWFISGMAALVTGILFFAGKELITPSARVITLHRATSAAGSVADGSNDANDATKLSAAGAEENTNPGANDLTAAAPLAAIRSSNNTAAHRDVASGSDDTEERDAAYSGISITLGHPVLTQSDLSDWLSHVVRLPEQAPALAVIAAHTTMAEQGKIAEDVSAEHKDESLKGTADNTSAENPSGESVAGLLESLSARGAQHSRLQSTNASRAGITGKNHLPDSAASATKASGAAIAKAEDMDRINWLQDYAMNVLEASPKHGRTYLQLTLAPTINYRSIGGTNVAAEKFPQQTGPYAQMLNNPQGFVDNSPAVGFEVGGSILYRVTRNLSLKGGLQFNFNRYPMKAYVVPNVSSGNVSSGTANSMNSTYGYVLDSLNSSATGNSSGRIAETIDNDYFQLSAPVGFELRVLGNERLQFNIGATVQPSYLLNTDSYMLTADYHDYDRSPSKFRRWNVSGGAEAFLTYRTGNIRWQVGPEFRYQLFSSYISQYPITENLKGYGLKIGITKMLP